MGLRLSERQVPTGLVTVAAAKAPLLKNKATTKKQTLPCLAEVIVELQITDGDPKKSWLYSPHTILSAELFHIEGEGNIVPVFCRGSLVSGLQGVKLGAVIPGKSPKKSRGFFVFTDIVPEYPSPGRYQFRFALTNARGVYLDEEEKKTHQSVVCHTKVLEIVSEPFEVQFSSKFGPSPESSSLSKELHECGVKLRLKKAPTPRGGKPKISWEADRPPNCMQGAEGFPGGMMQEYHQNGNGAGAVVNGQDISQHLVVYNPPQQFQPSAMDERFMQIAGYQQSGGPQPYPEYQPEYQSFLQPQAPGFPTYPVGTDSEYPGAPLPTTMPYQPTQQGWYPPGPPEWGEMSMEYSMAGMTATVGAPAFTDGNMPMAYSTAGPSATVGAPAPIDENTWVGDPLFGLSAPAGAPGPTEADGHDAGPMLSGSLPEPTEDEEQQAPDQHEMDDEFWNNFHGLYRRR